MPTQKFLNIVIPVASLLTAIIGGTLFFLNKDVSFAFIIGSIVNIMLSATIWRLYIKQVQVYKNYATIVRLSTLKKVLLNSAILILAYTKTHHLISGLSAVAGAGVLPLVVAIVGYFYSNLEYEEATRWKKSGVDG